MKSLYGHTIEQVLRDTKLISKLKPAVDWIDEVEKNLLSKEKLQQKYEKRTNMLRGN